jgi:hypothetical protein
MEFKGEIRNQKEIIVGKQAHRWVCKSNKLIRSLLKEVRRDVDGIDCILFHSLFFLIILPNNRFIVSVGRAGIQCRVHYLVSPGGYPQFFHSVLQKVVVNPVPLAIDRFTNC